MLKKLLNGEDVESFKRLLDESGHIILTCHERPDGDAVGSTLGLYHLLQSMGKEVKVLTPDQPPRSLRFLPGFKDIVAFTKYPEYSDTLLAECDLVICCDFNKPSRQGALGVRIEQTQAKKVLMDHHLDPAGFTDISFSFSDMSSTCELVFRLICACGYYEEMNLASATCITTGIITDTRNLSVNSDDSEIYIVMYELLRKGVDKKRIIREALEVKSLDSFRLQAFALSERMTLLPEFKTAVITLSQEDLAMFNYEKGDTEGLVNKPLDIDGIKASFFLRQDPSRVKVSARSVENFPVSNVCEELFNGGGHLQAAGGECDGETLEECKRTLIESLPRYMKYFAKPQK